MLTQLARRMLTEPHPRLLWKFAWNFGVGGVRSLRLYRRRLADGRFFPAFTFVSVTSDCNLRCQGCWVVSDAPPRTMSHELLHRVLRESHEQGVRFFGILGGEPLLYEGLWDVLGAYPDCYFQLFTNGTLLDDRAAREIRRLGNITPLVSVEGSETVSDERRGGEGVFGRTMAGLEACRRHRLITGVATSVCRSNLDDLASDAFVDRLVDLGVLYLWYYIYRPVGADPRPDLALDRDELARLRRFMVRTRDRAPIILVDAYWDHEGRALCPASTGISHHINPAGDVEPCPPIQFAVDSVANGRPVAEAIGESAFLRAFRRAAPQVTPGCILMERPDLLRDFLVQQGARDTTGRGTGFDELAAMQCRCSHHLEGLEIPERNWAYRLAKKHWFFGFGAYA